MAVRRLIFIWLLGALLPAAALGCARSSGAPAMSDPASSTERADPAPAAVRPRPGQPAVSRSALLAVLERGPGAFLHDLFQRVEVEAHFEGGAFAGWQIVALAETADHLEAIGLEVGDVVKTINGYGIERPEYLSAIFAELRDADAIVIGVERAGEAFELRVPIVDD
jgi:type II secretory pathway component PulC